MPSTQVLRCLVIRYLALRYLTLRYPALRCLRFRCLELRCLRLRCPSTQMPGTQAQDLSQMPQRPQKNQYHFLSPAQKIPDLLRRLNGLLIKLKYQLVRKEIRRRRQFQLYKDNYQPPLIYLLNKIQQIYKLNLIYQISGILFIKGRCLQTRRNKY